MLTYILHNPTYSSASAFRYHTFPRPSLIMSSLTLTLLWQNEFAKILQSLSNAQSNA